MIYCIWRHSIHIYCISNVNAMCMSVSGLRGQHTQTSISLPLASSDSLYIQGNGAWGAIFLLICAQRVKYSICVISKCYGLIFHIHQIIDKKHTWSTCRTWTRPDPQRTCTHTCSMWYTVWQTFLISLSLFANNRWGGATIIGKGYEMWKMKNLKINNWSQRGLSIIKRTQVLLLDVENRISLFF